jgi:hypothetical protein
MFTLSSPKNILIDDTIYIYRYMWLCPDSKSPFTCSINCVEWERKKTIFMNHYSDEEKVDGGDWSGVCWIKVWPLALEFHVDWVLEIEVMLVIFNGYFSGLMVDWCLQKRKNWTRKVEKWLTFCCKRGTLDGWKKKV